TATSVRNDMRAVIDFGSVGASGGSIADVKNSKAQIGGKSSTADILGEAANAWFIGVAPVNGSHASTLSVVIFKQHGGAGACLAPNDRTIMEYVILQHAGKQD